LRGRRWATDQLNHAYAVLLSSQFQGFCRDLHSECVDCLVRAVLPVALQEVIRAELLLDRALDRGNPNAGNLGSDFNRLGVKFWHEVKREGALNRRRESRLEALAAWRNAIAHQDFDPTKLEPERLDLRTIRSWWSSCGALAGSFDVVMKGDLRSATGSEPW